MRVESPVDPYRDAYDSYASARAPAPAGPPPDGQAEHVTPDAVTAPADDGEASVLTDQGQGNDLATGLELEAGFSAGPDARDLRRLQELVDQVYSDLKDLGVIDSPLPDQGGSPATPDPTPPPNDHVDVTV
jgi:hypothetical protein